VNHNEHLCRAQRLHAATICIPCGSPGVISFDTENIDRAY
jgi:hypothetical protein